MKIFKIIFLSIFLVLALIIGALVIFVATFDANQYKQQITGLVNEKTGRKLNIEGNLKLAFYPDIAIELGKTSLSNAAGFGEQRFATVRSGEVSVKLMPLLKKQVKVDQVRLNGLSLNLHRKANGSTNWDGLVKTGTKPDQSRQPGKPEKIVQEMMTNLSVAGLNLKDATIHWRDDLANQDITLSPLSLNTGVFKPGKPLPINFSLVLKQQKPLMKLSADGSTVVTLSHDNQHFSLSHLKLHAKGRGEPFLNGVLDATMSANIKGGPAKISASGLSVQSTLAGGPFPQGVLKTNLSGQLVFDMNAWQLSVAGLELDATANGKALSGGTLHALLKGDTQFKPGSQKLTVPNMRVDAKLSGGYVKGGAARVKISGNTTLDLAKQLIVVSGMKLDTNASGDLLKGGAANAQLSANARYNLAAQQLNLGGMKLNAKTHGGYLKDGKGHSQITGDVSVDLANSNIKSSRVVINSRVEGGIVPGGSVTQQGQGNMDLNWANQQGTINLSKLVLKLANLELKGSQVKIMPLAERPAVSGQFQSNTFNLKQVLNVVGIASPVTKNPKALSKVQAVFALKADTDSVTVHNLRFKLDKSSISGKLAIKNFAAPVIQHELSIDRINLDDYLSPGSHAASGTTSTASGKQELLPLATLRKLDIDGGIKIGSMVVNKVSLSHINARIKARQGIVRIDPANASLYKGKYKGRITLNATQAVPSLEMHHELIGMRSEGLLFDLFQDKYISGDTRLVTDFKSRGNTINELLRNLNGHSSIAFKDGTIRDSKLAEKVSLAVKAFEKKELKNGRSVVKFTGLSGDWKTTNGVFKTSNLSLVSPYFGITGSGTADVAKQVLDMKLRIGPKSKPGERKLFAPLHIYGPFDKLKFSLDLQDLVKALAQQDIEKAKKKAREKLQQAKKNAQQRLAQEKKKIKQRLDAQAKAKQQALRKKVEDARTKAVKKVEDKLGSQLGNQLRKKLGGGDKSHDDANKNEPNKSMEDQVKDKLKNKLRGLF